MVEEVEEEAVEAEAEGELQQAARLPEEEEEEETRNSSELNHPLSTGTVKMLTGSCQTSKDICP